MKVIFLGCTNFSKEILLEVLAVPGIELKAVFTIPENFTISYSQTPVHNTNYADLHPIVRSYGIPVYEVDSVKGKRISDYKKEIENLNPELILVMGWYYMVPKAIRSLARYGAWGVHASLLPEYAGGAPLVWAIIEGRKETGVTLFQLSDGVDDGDILMQRKFPIEPEDTIREVYAKAVSSTKEIIRVSLSNVDGLKPMPQNKSNIKVYPQRSSKDGEIDWKMDAVTIKNFIRAQTKPYPGAWTVINGKKITIWDADLNDL